MQKRLLVCLVISIAFMVFWSYLMNEMGYTKRPEPVQPETAIESTETPDTMSGEESTQAGEGAVVASSQPKEAEEAVQPAEKIARRSDTLESESLRIVFDNEGGVIRDVTLKSFFQTSAGLDSIKLIFARDHFPGMLIFDNGETDEKWMYRGEVANGNIVYTGTRGAEKVIKTYSLEKEFQLRCEVSYEGAASRNFMMVVAEGLQPIGANEEIKPSLLSMGAINPKMMFITWSEEGGHETKDPSKGGKERFEPMLEEEVPIEWAGVKDNYFANVFLPDQPLSNLYARAVDTYPGREPITLPAVAIRAESTIKGSFYLGPIMEGNLAAADPRLENLITFGWAGLLSKWLFAGLQLAHDVTGNWGWAIVLLTLFIRFLMVPLTIPSVKSSFKMRRIQPKIEKLKQKYGGTDLETKQKLSQATFELYRKEGVNPFSSCFTALAQMPVFFAYFSLLRSSISLRQAEWIIWIQDLSVADTTFILPILMGVTMFLSTLAMPMPTADPAQAKMMKFMPVIFSLMFIYMPSGLILYMITSNIFTLGQTKFLQWRYERDE